MTKKNQHIIGQADYLHQLILLDEKGCAFHSCDSLFPANDREKTPLISRFPLLESVFPLLQAAQPGEPPLYFSKVETFHPDLPGVYDFRFSCVLFDGQKYILWVIYNYTDLYEHFRTYQQKKNELEIHRQYLEQRLDGLHSLEDLVKISEARR